MENLFRNFDFRNSIEHICHWRIELSENNKRLSDGNFALMEISLFGGMIKSLFNGNLTRSSPRSIPDEMKGFEATRFIVEILTSAPEIECKSWEGFILMTINWERLSWNLSRVFNQSVQDLHLFVTTNICIHDNSARIFFYGDFSWVVNESTACIANNVQIGMCLELIQTIMRKARGKFAKCQNCSSNKSLAEKLCTNWERHLNLN